MTTSARNARCDGAPARLDAEARLEPLDVPDVEPDPSTAGPGRGIESLGDVVMAAQGEVAEDDVVDAELGRGDGGCHLRSFSPN